MMRRFTGHPDAKLIFFTFIALLAWASAFAVIRAAANVYSPGAMALLRFLVASGVLALVAPRFGVHVPDKRDWPGLLAMGFGGIFTYHVALNWGEHTVTAGSAAFLVNISPIFVTMFVAIFLHEKVAALRWMGIATCFCGVGFISAGEHGGLGGVLAPGSLLIILAALGASSYMILAKKYLRKYRTFEVTCYCIWGATVLLLGFMPLLIRELPAAPLSATLGVVYMGVAPGALSYAIWSQVLQRLPASSAASLLYLVPIFSVALAWIILRETPSALSLLGGTLVLLGVVAVNWRR
jgi:drug/metabolite transporter (DMT)-like permease